jgi:hypothetical protein
MEGNRLSKVKVQLAREESSRHATINAIRRGEGNEFSNTPSKRQSIRRRSSPARLFDVRGGWKTEKRGTWAGAHWLANDEWRSKPRRGASDRLSLGQRVDARQGLAGWLVSIAGDVTAAGWSPPEAEWCRGHARWSALVCRSFNVLTDGEIVLDEEQCALN